MRIRHCVAVSFATIVVGLVACGGSPGSSCGSYFDQLVSTQQKCDPGAIVDTSQKSNFESYCDALSKAPGANNLSGQIDTCSNLVSNASCGATINCKVAGTLPDGAACGAVIQCAGARCDTTNGTAVPNSEITCGKCGSYLAVGGDCSQGGVCDPGTSSCVGGKCVAYAQQGQSCASAQCVGPLLCDAQAKTCQQPPTKGQACTQGCEAPYKCIQGTCADAVQSGGACTTNECAGGLECDQQTKTCKPITLAASGQPCGFLQNQIVGCQSGLKCQISSTSGTCIQPKQAGEACTVGKGECATFLACTNGTCAAPDFSVCK